MTKKETLITAICGLFILLFFYTAFSKWMDFGEFEHQMANQPFDRKYLNLLLYGLPSLEILTALLLIPPQTRLISLWSCLLLMVAFTFYIVLIKLNYYGRIPCSCGGVIRHLSWTQHLIFNVFFLALAVTGVILERKSKHLVSLSN